MQKRLKVVFSELEKWEEDYIKIRLKKDFDLRFIKKSLSKKNINLIKDADIIAIFIHSIINNTILEKTSNLKLICTMSTGFDHIDLQECKKNKIVVCNIPTYGENTVAEHTFALILSISRKIHISYDQALHNNFSLQKIRGFDLKDKTLGIIGLGNIGKHVARIAKGFEMNILVYDPKKDKDIAKNMGFNYSNFDDLLSKSDIISLHCPYNSNTNHLINVNNINKIKKGAILINTARGGLIETQALIKALQKGILSYAGLDVIEEEGYIKEEKQLLSKTSLNPDDKKILLQNHKLINHPHVLYTPHNAFNSEEALKRILDDTISNIRNFKNGRAINRINTFK